MSVRASLRWWWFGLVVSMATLAGLWLAEYTVDLPRVDGLTQLAQGTLIAATWLAAGLISWRARPQSPVGPLMVLVGCLYPWNPLSALAGSYGQWAFLMFGGVEVVIFVHVVLAFPSGPLTWPARTALSLAWTALLLSASSSAVKPASDRCPVCPANPLPTAEHPELSDTLWTLGAAFALASGIITATILLWRWRHASPPARRALAPMLWGTFQYAVVDVYWISIGRFLDLRPGTLASYSWGLIPIGVMIGMLRTRQHRSVVADLIVDLGRAPEPAALRDLLARTLGDPSLQLAFWLPDRHEYVDATGAPVTLPPDDELRRVRVLRQNHEPLAALLYDPALLEDPKLLDAVSAAARLAIENSRLQAELRARLHDVRESRARLVNATDAERRRIERNLHDGAQQTLLGLRLAVRLARNQHGGEAGALGALLAEIDTELQSAVEELRTLARGVHPAVLTDEGLGPALATLARRTNIPTQIRCDCSDRLPSPVETAAYYVASEALANVLKHAHATHADIHLALADGRALIEVTDDGDGGADPLGNGLRSLRDRVEALDGALYVHSDAGAGTRIRAEIPCG